MVMHFFLQVFFLISPHVWPTQGSRVVFPLFITLLPLAVNQDMEHSKIPLFNRGSLMGKFSIIRGQKVWVLRIFYIFSGYEEYSQNLQFVIPDPVNIPITR
jgi:hypothetical protein